MVRNLQRLRQNWARLTWVFSREGADSRTSGQIYLAAVQSILVYGSDTWVLTLRMKRVLGVFHHRADLRLTGWQPHKVQDGG